MSEQRKKRFGCPVSIGFMCLLITSCGSFKKEATEVRVPVTGQTFRTNGMEEHLSKARAASGRLFLARNATRPGVVERPSGLQFLVLREGTGACPRAGDSVTTHYRLFTTEGNLIDDSRNLGGPQQFAVDKVIAGWREALQEMGVGAQWRLFLPPDLAYGTHGLAHIPGGETLVYELSLLGINANVDAESVDLPAKPVGSISSGKIQKVTVGGLARDNLDLID